MARPHMHLYTVKLATEHDAVEEEQSAQRLALRRGADMSFDGEISQEGDDFGSSHFLGLSTSVVVHEAAHPSDVALLGARAVMTSP